MGGALLRRALRGRLKPDLADPQLSVLLPVRDGASYLRESLQSVRDQSFGDFELIVVDDGSTDATPRILDELAREDARLVVLRRQPAGVAAALATGLAHARAPLVARIDADDAALPTRFDKQIAFLAAHPQVGVLGTALEVVDAAGRAGRRWQGPEDHARAALELLFRPPLGHPTVMLRRALLDEAGGYDPAFEGAEDYELWTRLVEITRFANLPEPLVRYRVHPGAVTHRRGRTTMREVTLRARRAFRTRLLERPPPPRRCEWLERLERGRRLSRAQSRSAGALWLDLHEALARRGILRPEEATATRAELTRRLSAAVPRRPRLRDLLPWRAR